MLQYIVLAVKNVLSILNVYILFKRECFKVKNLHMIDILAAKNVHSGIIWHEISESEWGLRQIFYILNI